jgi:hypothetical protein
VAAGAGLGLVIAMSFEFGVPDWLKARPVLYLVSHMAIMPLIDLLLTGIEWVPGGGAASGLWMFLALSFVNGCVLEIGRKLWAPENEIAGVETYSGLWGPQRAAMIWSVTVILSLALLLGVGRATDTFLVALILGGTIGAWSLSSAAKYAKAPTPDAQGRMDRMAGLWVFACYAIAGFAPVLTRLI